MLESTLSIPTFQISHDRKIDFRRILEMLLEDRSFLDLTDIVPVFEIFKDSVKLITISAGDIETTENNEYSLFKDKSYFNDLSCLEDYHFHFIDQSTGNVFFKGPFKILA